MLSPSSLTANYEVGTSATLTVRATATDPSIFSGSVYVYVVDSERVLSGSINLDRIDGTTFSATLYTSAALSSGHHQGTFQIQLCKDSNCAAQYPGSPIALPYDFNVTPAPLRASAGSSTAATVHAGGATTTVVTVSVSGPTSHWTASTSANWLQVNGGAGDGAGSFSVSFQTPSLAIGSYADKVTVRSADGQSVDVPFTLDVLPTQFALTSGVPSFTAVNGAPIAAQAVGFELDNKVPTTWTATSSAAWMTATPLSGTTPALVTLQPEPGKSGLASGAYSSDLVLSSPGIADKTVTSSLTLIKPTLSSPASSITLGGPKGRDFGVSPTGSVPLSLNTGTNAFAWALSTLPSWLSTNTPSGTVNQNGTWIAFVPNAPNVTAGSVSATVTVSATVNGDTVTYPLTVNLNADQRRLLASDWGVGFSSTPTGSSLSRTLKISDNFGGALAWTASSDSAWLTVTANGTTGSAPDIVLTADPSSLASGTISYANVTVSTSTPGVSSAVIRVGLWKNTSGLAAIAKLPLTYSNLIADKIRPYVYANNGGTTVDIYHAYSTQKIGTLSNVGAALGQMTLSPDGSTLYALDTAAKAVSVIDLTTQAKNTWTLDKAVSSSTPVLAIRPNGVEVLLVGDGTAYTAGRSLGSTGIYGSLTASADGRKVYTQDTGYSPASVDAYDVDYSAISGGVLMVSRFASTSFINGASNGQDIAVSADGSRLYVASGAPYKCSSVDPTNLSFIGSLPGGDAYPNNVEVTSDGRTICGIAGYYTAADFWVHSAAGALLNSYKVAGYAKTLKKGQMVVTPDGFVVVTLTDDPLMAFVPIGP